jgi:hypothetical protein
MPRIYNADTRDLIDIIMSYRGVSSLLSELFKRFSNMDSPWIAGKEVSSNTLVVLYEADNLGVLVGLLIDGYCTELKYRKLKQGTYSQEYATNECFKFRGRDYYLGEFTQR